MAKKFAKKVIAITAVTAMLCASCISASAATYTSTTAYYNGIDKIQVTTNVSGLTANDEVTYLAYVGEGDFDPATSEIVYVNQYTVGSNETTAKTFSYVTDSKYVGSSIMMAKADVNFENGAAINPGENETATIDGAAVTFNVSVDGATAVPYAVEVEEAGLVRVTLPVTLTDKEVLSVIVDDNVVATEISVIETGVQFNVNVTKTAHNIAITTRPADVEIAAPTFAAGAKYKNHTAEVAVDGKLVEVTGLAYAVIGDAKYTPVNYTVGVAFADEAVFTKGATGKAIQDVTYYDSIGNARGSDGKYAIVIIDDSDPAPTGKVYYATYMYDENTETYTYGSIGSIDLDTIN